MADVMAMELYGGDTFASGLTKVATNDLVFINIVHGQYVPQLVKEKKVITNFSEAMTSVYSQLDTATMDEVNKAVLGRGREASPYDSHPEIATRLDYARRFRSGAPGDDRPVSALFDHWADLHETAAKLYNMQLMHFLTAQSKG
jgi:hypothetical protein